MISLKNTLEAMMNKLKSIEQRSLVQEKMNFSGNWTAPHDGIATCCRRAKSNGAYIFIKDATLDTYVGMCTISNVEGYGSVCFPVVEGHNYVFVEGECYESRDWYSYYQ